MRRLTRSGTGVVAALWLVFIPLWFLLPPQSLFELLNGLGVATTLGVSVTFAPVFWAILAQRYIVWLAEDILLAGLFMLSVGLTGIFSQAWYFRLQGGATAGYDNWLNAGARWVVVTALLMLLVASGSEDGRVPPIAYRRAGMVVAAAVAAAAALIATGH